MLSTLGELVGKTDCFSPIVQTIADAVIITDPEERVLFLNTAAEDLTGCKHDEAR